MSLNIVGLSAHFHDSACSLLRDGALVAAAQEERFTRRKNEPDIPRAAFRYCLAEAGLTITDIDCLAYYESPRKKLERQLWMGLPDVVPLRATAMFQLDSRRPERDIREVLGYEGRLEFVEHHPAHAASSFYFSGFEEAAILTVDAVGEWATTTYGAGRGTSLDIFEEVHFPDSLGMLYSAITAYLGFEVNEGEYKVMGLAPYGRPRYVDQVRELIEVGAGGQFTLRMKYFDFLRHDRMFSPALVELFGQPPREPESPLTPFAEDVARSMQVVLEDVLLDKVRYLHSRVPVDNLCLAGGVALNCVANARILREGPFRRLFIQPAAGDAGCSLGAAALAHIRLTNQRPTPSPLRHVYLGPRVQPDDVAALFRDCPDRVQDFRGRESELLRATAARLAKGAVVGWCHGRMELGPRALGARSILADPRDPNMRDRINAAVKQREAFRPFAPAVLAHRAREHFDLDHPSPFMLETSQVISPLALPAITHVDRSARVQTVDADSCPRFYGLLTEFERQTGCPILLNTSFNLRGEPIVCTPLEALLCFIRSDMDSLVIDDVLLDRAALPASWLARLRGTAPPPAAPVSATVYTLL
ncbi:MAG: hypothetical protein L0211_05355 [Planctomycetaceae bacterium]|nr:hypothetical protein [Planctomycetaceae bacterium]